MTKEVYPFESDYTVPPGSILKEWLEEIGMSQAEFARRCGGPLNNPTLGNFHAG